MSTKIYGGRRVKAKNFSEFYEFLTELREKAKPVAEDLCRTVCARDMIAKIDKATYNDEPINLKDIRYDMWKEFDEAKMEAKQKGRKVEHLDFNMSMFVFINPEVSTEYVYLYPIASYDREMLPVLDSIEGVEEYAYWNNTDKPEDLSEAEWEERELAWDLLLPGAGSLIENGMEFKLYDDYSMPSAIGIRVPELLEPMTAIDIDTRIAYVFSEVRDAMYEEYIKSNKEVTKEWDGASDWMANRREWIKANELKFDAIKTKIAGKLLDEEGLTTLVAHHEFVK